MAIRSAWPVRFRAGVLLMSLRDDRPTPQFLGRLPLSRHSVSGLDCWFLSLFKPAAGSDEVTYLWLVGTPEVIECPAHLKQPAYGLRMGGPGFHPRSVSPFCTTVEHTVYPTLDGLGSLSRHGMPSSGHADGRGPEETEEARLRVGFCAAN